MRDPTEDSSNACCTTCLARGWLWRIGGFYPNPDVAIPVVVAVLERLYSHPPLPPERDTVRRVWHATIT